MVFNINVRVNSKLFILVDFKRQRVDVPPRMPKRPASTSLELPLYERLAKLAGIDKRSVSQVIETCVERSLSDIETEVEEKIKRRERERLERERLKSHPSPEPKKSMAK